MSVSVPALCQGPVVPRRVDVAATSPLPHFDVTGNRDVATAVWSSASGDTDHRSAPAGKRPLRSSAAERAAGPGSSSILLPAAGDACRGPERPGGEASAVQADLVH